MDDGGHGADLLRERLAGEHGDRHEHEDDQGGDRRHDPQPFPRGGHERAEDEREGGERHEHDHRVHDERVQGEPCDVEEVHTQDTGSVRPGFR